MNVPVRSGSGWRPAVCDCRGDLDAKLVMLPGHTLGHCGVAYREDGRWTLHAGDSISTGGSLLAPSARAAA